MSPTDILHELIDVAAGRRNLSHVDADAMHEALTPGYTVPKISADQLAQAQALVAAQAQHDAYVASQAAPEAVSG